MPVIQGGVVVFAMFVVLINLLMDLALHRRRPADPDAVMTDITERPDPISPPNPAAFARCKAILFGRPGTSVAVAIIVVFVLVAVLAPLLAPYDPLTQSMAQINRCRAGRTGSAPTSSAATCCRRMIYGSRNSLLFGLISPFFAAIIGTTLGVIAGYFGGIVDRVISRAHRPAARLPRAAARDHDRGGARRRLLEHHHRHHRRLRPRLRPRRPGADAVGQAGALCRGGDRDGRAHAGHHLPPHRAQHHGADRRR